MNIDNASKLEWEKTLQVLADKNAGLTEFRFFLNIAREYHDMDINRPKVILLGTFFPDEIIRAMGIDFYYVFGGSYESTLFPDVCISKDTDDEIISLIGILKDSRLDLGKNDIVLIPLYNDGMKKAKELLSDITTVICYEVPSDKQDQIQRDRFVYEIKRVTEELKKHFKRRLSFKKLKEQCMISRKAAQTFAELEDLFKEKSAALTASAFLFIASCYHMCKSRTEWIFHLDNLINELRGKENIVQNGYPEIILSGSPIYAPNYKALFVIEELRLRVHIILHPDIEHIKVLLNAPPGSFSITYLANRYLESNITPIFINSPTMTDTVIRAIDSGRIKGVIAHILKGQALYDYECRRIEQLTVKSKIPLNRIETVYNGSDVEQIRLRLEAFSEMLNLNNN